MTSNGRLIKEAIENSQLAKAQGGITFPKTAPVYDNIPTPGSMRQQAIMSQKAKQVAALKAAQEKRAEIRPAGPKRSGISKAWAIATNPMTALQYTIKGQKIPENFERGEQNLMDIPMSIINPAFYINEVDNFGKGVGNIIANPMDQTLESVGATMLHGLAAFPAMKEVGLFAKELSPAVNRAARTFRATSDLPLPIRIKNAANNGSIVFRVPGDVGHHSYFNMSAKQAQEKMASEMTNLPKGAYSADANMSKNSAPLFWTQAERAPKEYTFIRPGVEQNLNWSGIHGKRVTSALPERAKQYIPEYQDIVDGVNARISYLRSQGDPYSLAEALRLEKEGISSSIIAEFPFTAQKSKEVSGIMKEFMENYKPTLDRPIMGVNKRTGLNFPLTKINRTNVGEGIYDYVQPSIFAVKGSPLRDRMLPALKEYGKNRFDTFLGRNNPGNQLQKPPEYINFRTNGIELKKGGAVVDPRGQWAHPGRDTIVPTPNGMITMEGVPYPVYGEDETGYGQMMYPDGEYEFPGQMVYETPMMQKGGSAAIYTDNPNDPKLRAYNDSLRLYNTEGAYLKQFRKSYTPAQKKAFYKAQEANYNIGSSNRIQPQSSKLSVDLIAPDGNPDYVYGYKKPVQPVVYRKPEPPTQYRRYGLTMNIRQTPKQAPIQQQAPLRQYTGSPVYSPGAGSGMPSALVGFRSDKGDTTFIQPEDYERFAVPAYGRQYIKSVKNNYESGGESEDPPTVLPNKRVGKISTPLSRKNLRPVYPNQAKWEDLYDPNCPDGIGCSKQATVTAQKITGLPYVSYAPADAGYRDAVAKRTGLKNIFDQEGDQKKSARSYDKGWKFPVKEDFDKWKAGDIVTLDAGQDFYFPYDAPPGFTSDDNSGVTHNGAVVGFTKEGRPVIKHGYASGKNRGRSVTEPLGMDNRVSDMGHGRYAVKSVWRPKEVDDDGTLNKVSYVIDKGTDAAKRKQETTSNEYFYLKNAPEQDLVNNYPVAAEFSGANNRLKTKKNLINQFNNKELDKELQYKLGMTAQEVNNLKPVLYGVFGQESNFNDIDNLGAATKEAIGNVLRRGSRGPAQIKFSSLTKKEREVLGIKKASDLENQDVAYKAGMLLLNNARKRMNMEVEQGTHPELNDADEYFRAGYYYNSPGRAVSTAKEWGKKSKPVTLNPLTWFNKLTTRDRSGILSEVDPNYAKRAELRMDPGSYPYKLMEKARDLGVGVDFEKETVLEPVVVRAARKGSKYEQFQTGGRTQMFADGGLLSRSMTCSNCGHSWKSVEGGMDPLNCHKCGGMVEMKNGGQHGGLDRWFAEKWVDVKTGKDCGRQEGEKRKGYPACRPSKRVSDDTPKTASELSSSEREKFKRSKTSSERINYQHRRKEYGGEQNENDMANKPNNPSLWSRAKSLAKQKFDVYPSAYANGWAAKWYKGKGGTWRKAEYGMEVPMMEEGGKPEWLMEAQLKAQGYSGDALQQKMSSMGQGGEPQNEGFQALPEYVQNKIMGAAFGGYIPEMTYGGPALQAAIDRLQEREQRLVAKGYKAVDEGREKKADRILGRAARVEDRKIRLMDNMAYGGVAYPFMADGGEANGEMALGQMASVQDKMSKLLQFVRPDQNLDPWIASKLAVMDHSADAIADYMMYGPEAEEMQGGLPMEQMRDGGYTVTRSNDRKGKTHKVTGPDGTVKYFGDSKLGQHPKDPERKAAFYARHKKNLDGNPFFRAFARETWADGGEFNMMAEGGYIGQDGKRHLSSTPTWSGNAGYEMGGYIPEFMSQVLQNSSTNSTFARKQMGGPAVGEEMEVTPEQLEILRQQGYQFEII